MDPSMQDVTTHPHDVQMQKSDQTFLNTAQQEENSMNVNEDFLPDKLPVFNKTQNYRNRRVSVSAESMQPPTLTAHNSNIVLKSGIPKSKSETEMIANSLKQHFLFKSLEEDESQQVIDSMTEKKFKVNETVIEQNAVGDFFYVVSQGTLDCFVDGHKVVQYKRGGSFGELALMYNAPRAATLKTTSDTVLWALDRISFRSILMKNNATKRRMHTQFLESVPLFKSLDTSEIHKIADALESVSFDAGNVVLNQGDTGDNFYLIERGEALFYKKASDGSQQLINTLKEGDYFGELALLTDRPRAATVVAKSSLKCVTLGRAAFTRLLGPVMDILKRNTENYHAILKEAQTSS